MVTVEILDSVLSLAIDGLVKVLDDLGARRRRATEMRIDVINEHRQALSSVAQLSGTGDTGRRTMEHDPGTAETDLGAADGTSRITIAILLNETKGRGEPRNCVDYIAVNNVW